MIARRLMDPSPKLNWDVVVSVRDAINTQHWIRGRYAEDFRGASAGLYCINLLLDSDYVHAADILVNGVKVFVAPSNCATREAGEQAAGNGDVHDGNRTAFEAERTLDPKQRGLVAGRELKVSGADRISGNACEREQPAVWHSLGAIIAKHVSELIALPLSIVTRHIGAAALLAHQNVGCNEIPDSGPDGQYRHAKTLGKLRFGRNAVPRFPFALRKAVENLCFDLFVKRFRRLHFELDILRGSRHLLLAKRCAERTV